MTTDLYGRDHKKTIVILLLGANLLLLLAFFVQMSRQKRTADRLSATMEAALSEQSTSEALDRLDHEHEIVLRERLQARLQYEEARAEADDLAIQAVRLEEQVAILTADLAATRAERDEHQSARSALERRLSDALDLLATLDELKDELKARAGELDAALDAVQVARAETVEAATEIDRLRRQVIVLDRLVAALKARLSRGGR